MQITDIILLKSNKKFILLLIVAKVMSIINFVIQITTQSIFLKIIDFSFLLFLLICLFFLIKIYFTSIKISQNKVSIINGKGKTKQYNIDNIIVNTEKSFILIPTHTILSFFIPLFFSNYKKNEKLIINMLKDAPVATPDKIMIIAFRESLCMKIFSSYIVFLFLLAILKNFLKL